MTWNKFDRKQAEGEPITVTMRKFLEELQNDSLRLYAWWTLMTGYCRECGAKEPSHDAGCKYRKAPLALDAEVNS